MAVTKLPQKTSLGIKIQTGLSAAGNPVYKTLGFSNIKAAATDDNVYAVGMGLSSLQAFPAVGIMRTDNSNLINT